MARRSRPRRTGQWGDSDGLVEPGTDKRLDTPTKVPGKAAAGRDSNRGRALYATASIVRPTLSTISPIWTSLITSGGVSSIVSPERRSMIPASWKEYSSAA